MVFNRKDYGMDKGVPFIKIAVDVNFHLKWKHVAGPPLASPALRDTPELKARPRNTRASRLLRL
jgi:hypothetical protein